MTDMPTAFDLSDRVAVVSGAGSGIGAGIAEGLAEAGADLVLTGRTAARLEAVAERIQALGRAAHVLPTDVVREGDLARSFAALDERGIVPTIVVANAAVIRPTPSLDLSAEDWDRTLDANLKGAFLLAQQGAQRMSGQGRGGSIIFVGSATSLRGSPGSADYAASKSGLLGLIRALSVEWGPFGIRVNGIGPGFVPTPMTESAHRDRAWQEARLASIPLGRFGEPRDIAGPAVFLSSDAAAYVTGQMLYIDGGYVRSL